MSRLLTALLGILAIFFLVLIFIGFLRRMNLGNREGEGGDQSDRAKAAYRLADAVLSQGELAFYKALAVAVGDEYLILIKPRLADLLTVDAPPRTAAWRSAWNRIQSKHVDFLLVHPASTAPVLAIELDDRSHQRASRRERDQFVDDALAAAGLPIWRVRAAASYAPAALRQDLTRALPS